MAKKNPADAPQDFDDLLAQDEELEAQGETPEQARIRELEEQLAAPLPSFSDDEEDSEPAAPAPPVEKTPEQLRIEELEDQLARRNTLIVENTPTSFKQSEGNGERILIHFREDGLNVLGQIWVRGQEVEIVVGSPEYERTKNRFGQSWLAIRDDEDAQLQKWGKRYIASGPFRPRRGEEFDDAVAKEDRRRGRAVPVVGR